MSLDNVYYPHALRLPSPEVTHLDDVSPDRGLQVIMQRQAGSPAPCYVGVASTDPTLSFSTPSLKPVLDSINGGVEGIVRDLSGDNVELYYRAGRAMEIREDSSDTVHVAARLSASAMMFWTQLSVQTGSVAQLQANIVTAKRGLSDPMIWLGEQQLPGRAGCSRIYGMGPVYLNSNKLDGVTGLTLSSNVQTEPIRAGGSTTNVYQGVREYHVQCQLNMHDISQLHEDNEGGDEFSTLEIYLRRMVNTNVFAADNVAEHIKITLNGGLKTVPGANGVPVAIAPMFYTEETAGSATHTINTASTIA